MKTMNIIVKKQNLFVFPKSGFLLTGNPVLKLHYFFNRLLLYPFCDFRLHETLSSVSFFKYNW